jgi:hypothetical protein
MSAASRPHIVALHAILVSAGLLTGTVTAESRAVTLRLQNVGRAGRQWLAAVRVVDASQGAVVTAEPVGKRGVAKLVLPAGVDFALGTVVRQNGARTGVSRVFLVGRKRPKPVAIPLTSTVALAVDGDGRTIITWAMCRSAVRASRTARSDSATCC